MLGCCEPPFPAVWAAYSRAVKCPKAIVITNACALGGQLVLHDKALAGNPYDGRTLGGVIGKRFDNVQNLSHFQD
jgi:hypothetical protein